jgi:catechol 2,3-dioxygenase-like lactoylglutathione lyase family enzyme
VQALDHIAVTVSDLSRSLPFYTDILGLEETERHLLEGETISTMAGKPGVVMQVVRLKSPDGSPVLVDLQQYISPKGAVSNAALGMANHSHFCFQVKNLQQAYEQLTAKGVEFVSPPVAFGDYDPVRVVFFKDPDGFILELVEVREKAHAQYHWNCRHSHVGLNRSRFAQ